MCRANCVRTRCVVCRWTINRTYDVMVHCEVFWQTERCPGAEYPTTVRDASAVFCGKCNPPPWQRDVEMQPQEDVDMQTQEDVDMQLEGEARSSNKAFSVERAEPGNRFKDLIDEVTRRSTAEDEQNDRNGSDELSRTTLSPEFYYTTRAGRRIPAPRGTPPVSPTPARRTRRTRPDHPAT
ncbi:uncharacterized protein FIESC28_00206 [Fusarium coffeatum]|uniref:Uncharacterized protein n=1 Tax=Fusarium coffeatum TaxID=231269 RepID=A0A366SDF6_9HYPO|nr:uncharacterized protein FIESC28_00206 [Fusarium coffeatum]RBR26938.1 hypothetical protein FIESC28_00206 [Fusarium coffeatum]